MIQTLKDIVKDNFPVLLEKWEKRPFVILSLVLLLACGYIIYEWRGTVKDSRLQELEYMHQIDSLKLNEYNLKLKLSEYSKYDDYHPIIDSTLQSLFKYNLLKNSKNDKN